MATANGSAHSPIWSRDRRWMDYGIIDSAWQTIVDFVVVVIIMTYYDCGHHSAVALVKVWSFRTQPMYVFVDQWCPIIDMVWVGDLSKWIYSSYTPLGKL